MKKVIQIDIVSDVVCPWCYVGKKRLEQAIALSPEYDFKIYWYPYQLNPFVPDEGVNHTEYLAQKFGSLQIVEQAYQRLNAVGKEVGINFAFDKIEYAINTFQLHRILTALRDTGKQGEVKAKFLEAFFEKALDLRNQQVIRNILEEVGLSAQQIEQLLDPDYFAQQTLYILEDISKQGIRGVPLFIIDQKYGISGAQNVEVFLETFHKASPIQNPNLVCDIDNPNC